MGTDIDHIYNLDHTTIPYWKIACDTWHISLTRDIVQKVDFCLSYKILGEPHMMPEIISLLILPMTYILTNRITNSSIASLIATGFLIWDKNLITFGSNPVLSQEWTILFLASLYFVSSKKSSHAIPTSILGILSKILSIAYLPVIILFMYFEKHKNHKLVISLLFGFILVFSFLVIMNIPLLNGNEKLVMPDYSRIVKGLQWSYWTFADVNNQSNLGSLIVLVFDIVMLGILSWKKVFFARNLLASLVLMFALIPLSSIFIQDGNWYAYRSIGLTAMTGLATGFIITSYLKKVTNEL